MNDPGSGGCHTSGASGRCPSGLAGGASELRHGLAGDAVAGAINWRGEWADWCLAHGAGTNDGNLRVVELWETRGHWERFLAERLPQGITEALGDRARPPQITEVEFERFDTVAR